MCAAMLTEFTPLTADNFETSLASDDLLTHYFNDFLSLPSFPKALMYNQETGLFEVVSEAAEFVSRSIRRDLHRSKSQLLNDGPAAMIRSPPVENHYTVCCLDKEEGIQWIMRERLPFFLQSEYYIEYRLAKLLSQWDPNYCLQRRKLTSDQTFVSARQHLQSHSNLINNKALKVPTCSFSQEDISANQAVGFHNIAHPSSEEKELLNTKSCPEPENPHAISSLSPFSLELREPKGIFSSQADLQQHVTAPSAGNLEEKHPKVNSLTLDSSYQQAEIMAAEIVRQVLINALNVMNTQSKTDISDCLFKLGDQTGGERLEGEKETAQERKSKTGEEEKANRPKKNCEVGDWGTDQENVLDVCCPGPCCHGTRPGFEEFKEFLRGTCGEKLLNLWMDIERLKATQRRERKKRYVVLMRSSYLLSSSQSSLNVELLSRLGLSTSPCWTEEKLCLIQPFLTESLLHYWVPRFGTSQHVQKDHGDHPHPGLWEEMCFSPLSGTQNQLGCWTLSLLCSDSTLPLSSPAVHTQLYSSRSQLLSSRRIEKMLQALCVDSWAGLYFTNFCEQSGNQLWENAVNFWMDLQHYRELFYQDGLDPYRVQREAQLLYSTYLFSSARRSVGVNEEIRREVYSCMIPAFEELFDRAEEHTLNILLEPWMLLVSRDDGSFQKVCLLEEVRCVDSPEYRELQSLYKESKRRLNQMEQCESTLSSSPVTPSSLLSMGFGTPETRSRVSQNYQGYRLGSLLRHRHEIGHFMSFLKSQNASIHLTCWLDLEQYKRTPQKDTAVREERSSHIATSYLNWKYFFGPDSPATTEQQNDILRLAGGQERLRLDCLSNPVIVEIQDIVRSHIEKRWLPLFLSTAEFTERQKHQSKPQAADRLSLNPYSRRRARREAWKAEGLWMSSSKEILLFRRILLNPATCLQFQHFVFLKGDLLENDLLFWLEVQRYKDLCHSNSDEADIQQKISTIINCFINSSMPPALQIDIPPEQAQHILEERHELGPYIFREAQMSVFSELLRYWPEFQELSSCVQEEQLLPLLQEKRVTLRARVRRLRRKEDEAEEEETERRRAQKKLERRESSLQEDDETETDEDKVTEEQEQSREKTPTQWLSWSYSKYMAALKREEVLLRRQSELDVSTVSDSSSRCSVRSGGRKHSSQQPSCRSSGRESKRHNRRVTACNMK
ncbi:regulator of G-protein signaling 22 isoform X2 [Notolabrus celidotus]|uniref:regulator of G-protein signaling 22 isoform X2 n=1 Tax=Notolabrus celidotus TaxID=1203425 RepID=UPI00148FB11C|nr:regulator of G-protein signaling 22 isoform X2 [Notolabrus celidotus]